MTDFVKTLRHKWQDRNNELLKSARFKMVVGNMHAIKQFSFKIMWTELSFRNKDKNYNKERSGLV